MGIIAAILAFAFMPFVFWTICAILFFVIALSMDPKNDGDGWLWSSVGTIGLIALLTAKFGITFEDIKSAPLLIVYIAIAYFGVGTVWSFGKWYFKLLSVRDTYQDLKEKFIASNKLPANFLTPLPSVTDATTKDELLIRDEKANQLAHFAMVIRENMLNYTGVKSSEAVQDPTLIAQSIKPLAARHKSTITQWIAFWPISFVWTMINDPVRKIVNYIFKHIRSTFQRMSDSMFKDA